MSDCQAAAAIENGEGFVQKMRVLGVRRARKDGGVGRAYRASLLPTRGRHEGFRAPLLLWDANAGEALEINPWADEEARSLSEGEGGPVPTRVEALDAILGERPAIRSYELRIVP